jgi:hypothetical protein
MKYIRFFLALLLFVFSHSVFSQTGLIKLISGFPSYDAVVTQFYTTYGPEAGQAPSVLMNFARKPEGWFIITSTIEDQENKTSHPFWTHSTGYLSLTPLYAVIKNEQKVEFPPYQSEEYTRSAYNLRMFKLHTFYGYNGWADDIIAHLQPDQKLLNDDDLYSLGRAHSARASSFVHHNAGATNLPMFTFNPKGNSINNEQLTDYYRENLAARECFKLLAIRNPVFYDIVGKIQTKYANEVMQAYLDLYIFQNEELAKKQLIPGIYPPEILANARNYLNNLPQGAIFISFGDNDTYPLWYVQIMENLRTDVCVINYSLLGLPQYVNSLRRGMNGNKINLSIQQSTYDTLEIVIGKEGQNDLNEQAFIAWMNDAKNIGYQINDFPGLYLNCANSANKNNTKDAFYKVDVALLDLYMSNKDRAFCGSYSADPLDIFGNNWLRLGLVEELNLCGQKKNNFDSLIKFYTIMDQEAYQDPKNFPFKPGTSEYIDDIVISKLYQNLLQNMIDCQNENRTVQLEKLKIIWNQWTTNWAVKPNTTLLNYYQEYLNPQNEKKPAKSRKRK